VKHINTVAPSIIHMKTMQLLLTVFKKTLFYFPVIWDIMRAWVKTHPLKKEHVNSPGHVILSKPSQTEVSFEFKAGANPASRQLRMTRFPENPEPEWGPKARYVCTNVGGQCR
jgi:hypothetical protein